MSEKSCILVGAGISGLLAAQTLRNAGWSVTLLEESRGVGGRMATRRVGGGRFDHGAQFFTVRDERFEKLVESWVEEGAVREWTRGFAGPSGEYNPDGHPRYRGTEGMTSIPELLARNLDVRTGERAVVVNVRDGEWEVACESGSKMKSSALILSAPVPQSLVLAESGNFSLSEEVRGQLEGVSYAPCIALMASLEGSSALPEPGGVQIKSEPLDWIGDNYRKGISDTHAITIHAGPEWSSEHFDDSDEEVAGALLSLAERWIGSRVIETSISRWRYSWVTGSHPEPCLSATSDPPLVLCGDAFGQPKVEGAALSGVAAADLLLDRSGNQT